MRQLVSFVTQMRKSKNEVEEGDKAILRGLIDQALIGTLPIRDLHMSGELSQEILGQESYQKDEYKLRDFLEENQTELDIVIHDAMVKKTESFLHNVNSMKAVAICGPSFSGKSTIISVCIILHLQHNAFSDIFSKIATNTCFLCKKMQSSCSYILLLFLRRLQMSYD